MVHDLVGTRFLELPAKLLSGYCAWGNVCSILILVGNLCTWPELRSNFEF